MDSVILLPILGRLHDLGKLRPLVPGGTFKTGILRPSVPEGTFIHRQTLASAYFSIVLLGYETEVATGSIMEEGSRRDLPHTQKTSKDSFSIVQYMNEHSMRNLTSEDDARQAKRHKGQRERVITSNTISQDFCHKFI